MCFEWLFEFISSLCVLVIVCCVVVCCWLLSLVVSQVMVLVWFLCCECFFWYLIMMLLGMWVMCIVELVLLMCWLLVLEEWQVFICRLVGLILIVVCLFGFGSIVMVQVEVWIWFWDLVFGICCMWCVLDLNLSLVQMLLFLIWVIIFLQLLCLFLFFDSVLICQFWCLVQCEYMWNRLLEKIVVLLLLVLVWIFRNMLWLLLGFFGSSMCCRLLLRVVRWLCVLVIFFLVRLCNFGLLFLSNVWVFSRLVCILWQLWNVRIIGLILVYLWEQVWKWVWLLIILVLLSSVVSFLQ